MNPICELNPNFKVVEFDHFRMQADLPSFVMSVSEWIESDQRNRPLITCFSLLPSLVA